METQENRTTPVVYRGIRYGNDGKNNCKEFPASSTPSAGSDAIYKAKSALIRNAKDAYGFRPMSPFRGVDQERKQPIGETIQKRDIGGFCGDRLYRHYGGLPTGIEKIFGGFISSESVAGGQTHDLLAMRAEANLRQQDINILQFAAFLPATLKNILSNLRKMDELLDKLHDLQKLKRHLGREDPRSLYLQWLFVWNQLYRDVVGGSRFLRGKARPIGSLVTGRANNTAERTESVTKRVSSWIPVGDATCDVRVTLSQRAVSIARVTCDVKYTHNALGLDNPAYIAWDLVKWSWVVDQIADIGLFISSLTSLHGLEFLGTSITDRVVNESIVTVKLPLKERFNYYEGHWAPGFSRRKSVTRVIRSNPTSTVTIRNPFQNSVMVTAAVAAAVSMKAGQSKDILARLPR